MIITLFTTVFAVVLTTSLHTSPVTLKDYSIGTQHVIYNNISNHSFTLGASKFDTDVSKSAPRVQNREVLVRERVERGESYTSSSNQYEIVKEDKTNNCVAYAKKVVGISRPIGSGGRDGINSSEPIVGAIGVERSRVHAVVIEKVEGDKITIIESNWIKNYITRRTLKRSDFMGFII